MKKNTWIFTLLGLAACAGSQPDFRNERVESTSANSRIFAEPPETVLRAARLVLESLTRESRPPASGAVKEDGNTVFTGWVYSNADGRSMRRIYGYTAIRSSHGTHVTLNAEEEEEANAAGEGGGWRRAPTNASVYNNMLQRLKIQLRSVR
jgi:hypothetical protein